MNKEKLEIAKTIAEIEDTDVSLRFNNLYYSETAYGFIKEYNPFSWENLGLLMVKYKVEIQYAEQTVVILDSYGDDLFWEFFEDENDIPRAILKCIITSQDDLTGYIS